MRKNIGMLVVLVALAVYSASACNSSSPTGPGSGGPSDPVLVRPGPGTETYRSSAGRIQIRGASGVIEEHWFPAGAFTTKITVLDPARDTVLSGSHWVRPQLYHSVVAEVDGVAVPADLPGYRANVFAVYRDTGERVPDLYLPGWRELKMGDKDVTSTQFTQYTPAPPSCGRIIDMELSWLAATKQGAFYLRVGDPVIVPLGWRVNC